jgi:hypothetical protein
MIGKAYHVRVGASARSCCSSTAWSASSVAYLLLSSLFGGGGGGEGFGQAVRYGAHTTYERCVCLMVVLMLIDHAEQSKPQC